MYKYLYRPSLMKRRYLCPASAILEHNIPDNPVESDICREGIMIHDALARGICPATFTQEQRDIFDYCINFKKDMFGIVDNNITRNVFIEKKLRLFDDNLSVIIDGTADFGVVGDDDTVSIVDWKIGYNEVDDVIDNLQLACYAAMAMQTFEKNQCICHVVQPRVRVKKPFTFTKLDIIIQNITNIIQECENSTLDNARYAKSDDMIEACRYCKANMICEARKKVINESANNMELDINRKKHLATGMTPVELTNFYLEYKNKLKIMNKFMDDVEKQIIKTAEEDVLLQECAGIKIEKKLGNRYIENQELAITQLESMGIQKPLISESMQLSISALEKLWIQTNSKKKGVTKKELAIEFKEMTKKIFKRDESNVISAQSVENLLSTRNLIQV